MNPQWVEGDWLVRFEPRFVWQTSAAVVQAKTGRLSTGRLFATVKRVSAINLGFTDTVWPLRGGAQARLVAAVSAQVPMQM